MAKSKKKEAQAGVKDYALLLSPLITEKVAAMGGEGKTAAFKVQRGASKTDIKAAIEKIFGVEVDKIRTCNFIGKLKRTTRSAGRTAGMKKAYVTLKPGHTIDIVEGL